MAKKKSVYSWIVFVLFAIATFFLTLSAVFLLFSVVLFLAFSGSPELQGLEVPGVETGQFIQHLFLITIILLISTVISLALSVNFLLRLYKVTPDLIKWTHITFGLFIFLDVLNTFIVNLILPEFFELADLWDPVSLIRIGLTAAVWVTFAMHLKTAKREKTMDFS